MNPNDVPTEVTKLVYTCPLSVSKAVSQDQVAELLAHYWPAIEAHVLHGAADRLSRLHGQHLAADLVHRMATDAAAH